MTDSNTLKPDLKQAQSFLEMLNPGSGAQFTFQVFRDNPAFEVEAEIIHGTLQALATKLTKINQIGGGVFVTVNETDLQGRKAENISKIRAVFADSDDGPHPTLPIEPTIVVESKSGDHAYWLLNGGATHEEFQAAQKSISRKLKSDPKVCDPPRVMRLPGFFHRKDPQDSFLVKIKASSKKSYSIKEIFAAFPPPSTAEKRDKEKKVGRPNQSITAHTVTNEFATWASSLPAEKGSQNAFGGRNNTLLLLVREGLGCGVAPEEIRKIAHDYCRRSELEQATADKMLWRQADRHRSAPFAMLFVGKTSSFNAAEAADHFLVARDFDDGEHIKLRFYKGDFYRYTQDRYIRISSTDIRAEVMAFLREADKTRKLANINFASNVLANLQGKALVSEVQPVPCFLSKPEKRVSRLISVENGILDVELLFAGDPDALHVHTPDFFSTSCLPFAYSPEAKCPKWIKVLKEILPDPELRRFMQEWFGLNLVFDTSHHAFALFVGEGANGKSVVCTVLRTILGTENVSAVGLEQFNPTRTFPLTAMVGKLANIVEEIGEVDKVAEGVLKDLVAGGVMTVERKNQAPFETRATARLTFATNVLPRFRDRSNGLWRRMIPVPFTVQILDPAKQDRRLVDPNWWISSCELPGIFNWALRGLARLKKRGRLTEPKASTELRKQYQDEANPAATFLGENYIVHSGTSTPSGALYLRYKDWMEKQGSKPLGQLQFAREVHKRFPGVELTKNARRQPDGERCRVWVGLAPIDAEDSL